MVNSLISWNDGLSVNNPVLDEQHKKLIQKINELYDACVVGLGRAKIEELITFMEDYSKEHFAYEEEYFKEKKFPEASTHCEMHRRFTERVGIMKQKLDEGNLAEDLAMEIAQFGSDWLMNHTKKADHRFCEFIRTGKCPK